MATEPWQDVVSKKQLEVASMIPDAWRLPESMLKSAQTPGANVLEIPAASGILSAKQLIITESYDATDLLGKIEQKELSAYEVTEAFCKRAALAQQVTYCLTEVFFEKALERAKELDEILSKTGRRVGPLHGLPVSLKECFNVEGVPSSLGFTSFVKNGLVKTNSAVVEILLKLGAIPYVKTNIPQTMMAAESHNNVFGRTLNPHRTNLTAGGSSGGEGALIAMRGSVLGVGTDIAGSIRIPALCNGTFGFKPSVDRIPYGGQTSSSRGGMLGIKPCAGPLATSVRDLEMFMQAVIQTDPWELDSSVIFSPWRTVTPKKVLRLGLIEEDPHLPLHPPIQRTLTEAVDKLRAAGHEVIPLDLSAIFDACVLGFRMFAMDPAKTALKHISASGEPVIPALATTALPQDYMPFDYAPLTLEALYDLNEQRTKIKELFRSFFVREKLDAVISAGYQSTAVPHDTYGMPAYTTIWNVTDYPSCVIPHGKADKTADGSFIRDVNYVPSYAIEGAPCSVQLGGRNMQDEELVQVAKIVSEVIKS
ncbi:unnamed protein product [Penicillium olsonii]|nr:unnamed protein product [Penicillium olsonii]